MVIIFIVIVYIFIYLYLYYLFIIIIIIIIIYSNHWYGCEKTIYTNHYSSVPDIYTFHQYVSAWRCGSASSSAYTTYNDLFMTSYHWSRVHSFPSVCVLFLSDAPASLENLISRHKVWSYQSPSLCKSGYYRHLICIYGVLDLLSLAEDHTAMFVNKLMANFQPATYDCLEERLFNRTRDEQRGENKFDLTFYRNRTVVTNHF